MVRRVGCLTGLVFFLAVLTVPNTRADTIIDFSPDTTGAPLGESNHMNTVDYQIKGDKFVLPVDTLLTGGSIFSSSGSGDVGDTVRFMVFEDLTGDAPIISIDTTIDIIDTAFTATAPTLTRKHATIASTFLSAGTYWFSMPGVDSFPYQAKTTSSGGYDDGVTANGITVLWGSSAGGDMFFQLEGTVVPEPSTFLLLSMGLAGLLASGRRNFSNRNGHIRTVIGRRLSGLRPHGLR